MQAAPYPPDGLSTTWEQAGGVVLQLRVFGDEFYGRTTTEDGYTVIFSPEARTYFYAEPGSGGALSASTVRADQQPPPGLSKGLRESAAVVAAERRANVETYAPDQAARWSDRMEAVRNERERAASGRRSTTPGGAIDARSAPVSGSRVGLMILVQFPDDPYVAGTDTLNFPTTRAKMERFANEAGYADDGNSGSIRDYYYDQSGGRLVLTHLVTPLVTMPHPRDYYNFLDYPNKGTLPRFGVAGRRLLADAISKLKASGFDFSGLTTDSDHRVVATSVLFAGGDSGVWPRGLWPHAWSLAGPLNVGTDASPLYIYRYQATNVPSAAPSIGTICHELGHLVLDYPDVYDTDVDDGDSEGVGEHCLMGVGNYLNASRTPAPINLYLKDYSGWASITDLAPSQVYEATLATTGNTGYRIRNPAAATEYFLFENRGAGDKWAASTRDKGVMIWHVDEAVTTGNKRQQMTAARHYLLSLVQADGRFDLEKNVNRGDATDLYDATTGLFNDSTVPGASWWPGTASGVSVAVPGAAAASMTVRFGAPVLGNVFHANPPAVDALTAGGSLDFQITSSTPWSWSRDAAWITSGEAAVQAGSQTFTCSVAANPAASSRTGVITVTGGGQTRTITITQPGVAGDDHGNTTALATIAGQTSDTAGSLEKEGDFDFFRINVTQNGWLSLESTGRADVFAVLLDGAGVELAHDDDGGDDLNFRLGSAVAAGPCYVQVKGPYPAATGSYHLLASFTSAPSLALTPPSGTIVQAGESPSFPVVSNTLWTWSVDVPWLKSDEKPSQIGSQTFTYTAEANPTPVTRVAIITARGAGLTSIQTIYQPGAPADDTGNNMASARVVSPNSTTGGSLEAVGDVDFFRIVLPATGTLVVQTGGGTDTFGTLLDAGGGRLAGDDDTGADSNFLITAPLPAGVYFVRVAGFSPVQSGAYSLVSSFTPSPAVSITPAVQAVVPSAGGYDFAITANTSWSWSSNAGWLTSTEAVNQSGNQTFTCAASANASAVNRVGIITFVFPGGTASLTLTQVASGKADLADAGVSSSVSSTLLTPGQTLGINGTVVNQGTVASVACVVRYYLSADTSITSGDVFLGERTLPALAAGAGAAINATGLTVPAGLASGVYFAGWLCDAADVVSETGEANNAGVVAGTPVTFSTSNIRVLTQTLADGSISRWGDLADARPNFLAAASLTTPSNGTSLHAFDAAGVVTLGPGLSFSVLGATSPAGPLTAAAASAELRASRSVRLVTGRHATDDEISLTNVSAAPQRVTLAMDDDYGSDAATQLHTTSSGDRVVGADDAWFVCNDQSGAGAVSGGPTLLVSWKQSATLPCPRLLTATAAGVGRFSLGYDPFVLPAGQTATLTIRRELFDSADLALALGRPVNVPADGPPTTSLAVHGGVVDLGFAGLEKGIPYAVQRSVDLVSWESLGVRSSTSPLFSEPLPAQGRKVYYRLRW